MEGLYQSDNWTISFCISLLLVLSRHLSASANLNFCLSTSVSNTGNFSCSNLSHWTSSLSPETFCCSLLSCSDCISTSVLFFTCRLLPCSPFHLFPEVDSSWSMPLEFYFSPLFAVNSLTCDSHHPEPKNPLHVWCLTSWSWFPPPYLVWSLNSQTVIMCPSLFLSQHQTLSF